jgi:hypothetical protein
MELFIVIEEIVETFASLRPPIISVDYPSRVSQTSVSAPRSSTEGVRPVDDVTCSGPAYSGFGHSPLTAIFYPVSLLRDLRK